MKMPFCQATSSSFWGIHQSPRPPIWAFKPDTSKTKTTYNSLNNDISFGIKTGETINLNTATTTNYQKDLWGRALVQPRLRRDHGQCTYELDQLLEVNLSGQADILRCSGRILTARTPKMA